MTANLLRYKLQHTPGEAVALILLAWAVRSVENFPLHEVKVSIQAGFYLEINTLSLTQPGHVNPRPELASLVQVDLVAKRAVLVVITVFLS